MSDDLDITIDQAVDAIAKIYWEDIARGIVDKDIDKVYDAAINLKATESTRASMREMFQQ